MIMIIRDDFFPNPMRKDLEPRILLRCASIASSSIITVKPTPVDAREQWTASCSATTACRGSNPLSAKQAPAF